MHTDPAPYNVLYGFCAACLYLVGVLKFVSLVRPGGGGRNVAGWGVVLTHLSTATAFTIAAPAVYERIDRALGIANVATLGVYGFILITSAGFQAVVVLWTAPMRQDTQPRLAGWLAAYGVTLLMVIALFLLGDTSDGEHPIDFDAHFAATPWIFEFLLLYYAGFGVAMGRVARLCTRYAGSAGGWLGRGLRWVAVGTSFALGYCLLKVISVFGIMAGADWDALSSVWAPLSASIGALLMIVGLTMPIFGPRITAANETWHLFRAYRALYPLWRAMYDANPTIALEPTRAWAVTKLRYRLGRRIIEILDGRLALAPYFDLAPTDQPDQRAAAREAAMIRRALRAKAAGAPERGRGQVSASGQMGSDSSAELRWLLLVAKEFQVAQDAADPHDGPVRDEALADG